MAKAKSNNVKNVKKSAVSSSVLLKSKKKIRIIYVFSSYPVISALNAYIHIPKKNKVLKKIATIVGVFGDCLQLIKYSLCY